MWAERSLFQIQSPRYQRGRFRSGKGGLCRPALSRRRTPGYRVWSGGPASFFATTTDRGAQRVPLAPRRHRADPIAVADRPAALTSRMPRLGDLAVDQRIERGYSRRMRLGGRLSSPWATSERKPGSRTAWLVVFVVLFLGSQGSARAQDPAIQAFGAECESQEDGLRYCEGSDADRVESFDGVPLSWNVTLPAEGDGNFPLVVLLGGWPGFKLPLEGSRPFSARGYAVLSYSARGTGGSCGFLDSRNHPGCLKGWKHLADARYEARDTQVLTGLLADEGLIDPDRIGILGNSYGAGQAVQLATLRDRVRLPDGTYEPWRSPEGLDLKIAGAVALQPWTDLAYALAPNGRTLDYTVAGATDSSSPIGVFKQSFVAPLYATGSVLPCPGGLPPVCEGYVAPPGAGGDAGADFTTWFTAFNAGEPYDGDPVIEETVAELSGNHSAYSLISPATEPAPLLISNGFTDDLFPVDEAIRYSNAVTSLHPEAKLGQFHLDYGHQRGQNKPADSGLANPATFGEGLLDRRVFDWLDNFVKGEPGADPFVGVEALTQTCPRDVPSEGPFRAQSWPELHPGEVRFADEGAKTIVSEAGDPNLALALDPVVAGNNPCGAASSADQVGTATYRLPPAQGEGYTLLGSPTVLADLQVTAPRPADTQIAARLWDVAPDGETQTLVARGLYRPDGSGVRVFQLHPGAWHFAEGHIPKLELLGQDPPYARKANGAFQIAVSDLELRLPTHEQPDCRQVLSPAAPLVPEGATLAPGIEAAPVDECKPRLRFSVRPRRVVVGERTRFLLRAKTVVQGEAIPLADATVFLKRRTASTDDQGKATIARRFHRPGPKRATVIAPELERVVKFVRVRPRRR